MRFTVAFVAGFVAMASAATSTASVDSTQASQIACLDRCDSGDVDCQSHCITVPSPDKAQANATINCVGNCDQGDGSKAATDAYSKCVQSCIADNYYKTGSGTPQQTGSSDKSNSKDSSNETDKSNDSSATATASGSDSTDASETESGSQSAASATGTSTGTSTGSSSSSTSSGNAAPGIVIGSTGFLGLIAAVLAL